MGPYIIEFLGTLFLVFIVLYTGNFLAIGAALALGVLLGGKISGGAFNPAVAIALYSAGKIDKIHLIPYIVVEVLGGLAGYYAYKLVKKM